MIPTFRAASSILNVLQNVPPEIDSIFVIDDACPNHTGRLVEKECFDPRVTVIYHGQNQGVGGAVITGYREAFMRGADIVVKVDSDGQMDPKLIPQLTLPLISGIADYAKGNRFHNPDDVRKMPLPRLIGNLGLSFLTKFSTGYWGVFDPTNGFTALHRTAYNMLPQDKISKRYFFETDMLFRLHIIRAVVADMPMKAVYAEEESNLSISHSLFEFAGRHVITFCKRIAYEYFLRDFTPGSFNLVAGIILVFSSIAFGVSKWAESITTGTPATAGTVVLSAMLFVFGVQLIQGFMHQDYGSVPKISLQQLMNHD